jgi:hypothetical protein
LQPEHSSPETGQWLPQIRRRDRRPQASEEAAMTTVAPRPTEIWHRRHPRLVTALGIALLIAGLTVGLLLAFSSGGTARPSGEPSSTRPATTVSQNPPAVDPCHAKLRGPC